MCCVHKANGARAQPCSFPFFFCLWRCQYQCIRDAGHKESQTSSQVQLSENHKMQREALMHTYTHTHREPTDTNARLQRGVQESKEGNTEPSFIYFSFPWILFIQLRTWIYLISISSSVTHTLWTPSDKTKRIGYCFVCMLAQELVSDADTCSRYIGCVRVLDHRRMMRACVCVYGCGKVIASIIGARMRLWVCAMTTLWGESIHSFGSCSLSIPLLRLGRRCMCAYRPELCY